jgi:hypothetical protein
VANKNETKVLGKPKEFCIGFDERGK